MEYHTINCNPRRGDIPVTAAIAVDSTERSGFIINPFDTVRRFDFGTKKLLRDIGAASMQVTEGQSRGTIFNENDEAVGMLIFGGSKYTRQLDLARLPLPDIHYGFVFKSLEVVRRPSKGGSEAEECYARFLPVNR